MIHEHLFFDLSPRRAGRGWITIRLRCSREFPLAKLESRATELVLHDASTTPIAACANIWKLTERGPLAARGVLRPRPVAYFSAEFRLHDSVTCIYSGGLENCSRAILRQERV